MALRNDCFALPSGVSWTPVEDALADLRARLSPVAGVEDVALSMALGRVLARDVASPVSLPPADNAAVDGYALAHASLMPGGEQRLALLSGRSAAGVPFGGAVGAGQAVRILTGAVMPDGADSVVMDEDVDLDGAAIRFGSGLKSGANRRRAGEDILAGDVALAAGVRLGPAAMARLASVGVASVPTYAPLRVAIFSTGDELVEPGQVLEPGQIYDANRAMLLALARAQGTVVQDHGRIPDQPEAIARALTDAAAGADAVIVSGGASGGDEDHVSRALSSMGAMALWRIAMKPGRPLALGQIGGVPVFGLPGNPVAAFVCFLIFARPALHALAGAAWPEPVGYPLTARFSVRKKPGRAEFLRGRADGAGGVEKFRSEGSGLIGGLVWSGGLIALDHDRGAVEAGEVVRFLPYAEFGLTGAFA